ncbi:MAG TPA: SDR family NAD(P)-dependent oxidoreductase [Acidimicrobiia bacterium]
MDATGTAMVTGASRGLGRAIAIDLARAGFDVVATMRDPGAGKGLAAEIEDAAGTITVERLDVKDLASFQMPEGLRVLVNNSGIDGDYLPLEHTPIDQWREVFETNVFGLVEVTRRAIPALRATGGGVVCSITSSSITVPVPFFSVYRASKAAVSALDDTLRVELAPFGIRVVEIMPGPIQTDMLFASERIAEAVAYDDYRAMAEAAYEMRMRTTDQYTPAATAAAAIRAAILDDRGPMRYGCDPMSVAMIDMWRRSSDEELFRSVTALA